MTMQFRPLPGDLIDGAISEAAVLALRREIWPAGVIDAVQADDILAINEDVLRPSPEWTTFFVEAISEFLLNTGNPPGTLSQAQADWLILRLDHGERFHSPAKIALLVHLLEKMDETPAAMKGYTLAQIERSVIAGARNGTGVNAADCALMRRVIFTQSGSGPARVDADEAEMLFRIKDATLDADNAPEWTTLFVQGIANYLQSWKGLSAPAPAPERMIGPVPQRRATDRGHEVRTSANGLVSAVRGPGLRGGGGFGRRRTDRPTPNFVAEARAEYTVSHDNQQWLDDRLPPDGDLDPMEQALMAFMRADRGSAT